MIDDIKSIPLRRYDINKREIWLTPRAGITKLLKVSSRRLWDWESKGYIPVPIFRYPGRGYNVVTKRVEDFKKKLYTKEHAILLATWYETLKNENGNLLCPTEKQLALLHKEWEVIDKEYIDRYQLDTTSTVYMANRKAVERGRIKDPDLILKQTMEDMENERSENED